MRPVHAVAPRHAVGEKARFVVLYKTTATTSTESTMDDDTVVCRCEELTAGEIRAAIRLGLTTVTEVRRFTRAGMGLCQGKTCGRLVAQLLAQELGLPLAQLLPATARPPVRPTEMATLAGAGDET
jgi:NAD(P)H-nitrite reductase large subunit